MPYYNSPRYKQEVEATVEESQAKFTSGSIMKHVIVMSLTSSIGLVALFFVDLIDFYFISRLGQQELAAAIGYAGTLLFFLTSVSIGLSIAMGALVSKSLGQRKKPLAQKYAAYVLLLSLVLSLILTMVGYIFSDYFLGLLGASGTTLELANSYFRIVLFGMPIMSLAMGLNAILRAQGDAKHAMYLLLIASIVNGILDPIFIFGLDMGLDGAAYATLISRFSMIGVGIYFLWRNQFFKGVKKDIWNNPHMVIPAILAIAIPGILTNLTTPLGNAYVTKVIASYGDGAVTGISMIGRVSPMVFAVIFALSGAIGPIIGQNLGAQKYDRIKQTMYDSMLFSTCYILAVSCFLFIFRESIVDMFSLTGIAREIGLLFCTVLSWLFVFQAFIFIANAVFNNIGYAKNSTIINFLKATVFTIPFVYYGSQNFGVEGVLYGQAVGSVVIGIIALFWSLIVVGNVEKTDTIPWYKRIKNRFSS